MDETKKDPIYLPPGGLSLQELQETLMQFFNLLDALEALTPKRSFSGSTDYVPRTCTALHTLASRIHFLAMFWAKDDTFDADRVFVNNVRCAIYPNGLDEPKEGKG